MRLLVQVLGLPKLSERITEDVAHSFVLPVDAASTFAQVWTRLEERFRENYADGQKRYDASISIKYAC